MGNIHANMQYRLIFCVKDLQYLLHHDYPTVDGLLSVFISEADNLTPAQIHIVFQRIGIQLFFCRFEIRIRHFPNL